MCDPGSAGEFLDAVIASFAVLGGTMAYFSGLAGARAKAQGDGPDGISAAVSDGVAEGFITGAPAAVAALIIALWS